MKTQAGLVACSLSKHAQRIDVDGQFNSCGQMFGPEYIAKHLMKCGALLA